MIDDLYDLEKIAIVLVSFFMFYEGIRQARLVFLFRFKIIKIGKSLISLAWIVLYSGLLLGLWEGNSSWFAETFVRPMIMFTLMLSLASLIECRDVECIKQRHSR